MGQVPVLEIDGIQLNQSVAMARYVANLIGLAGKSDWENLQIDIAVDNVIELRLSKSFTNETYLSYTSNFTEKKNKIDRFL